MQPVPKMFSPYRGQHRIPLLQRCTGTAVHGTPDEGRFPETQRHARNSRSTIFRGSPGISQTALDPLLTSNASSMRQVSRHHRQADRSNTATPSPSSLAAGTRRNPLWFEEDNAKLQQYRERLNGECLNPRQRAGGELLPSVARSSPAQIKGHRRVVQKIWRYMKFGLNC